MSKSQNLPASTIVNSPTSFMCLVSSEATLICTGTPVAATKKANDMEYSNLRRSFRHFAHQSRGDNHPREYMSAIIGNVTKAAAFAVVVFVAQLALVADMKLANILSTLGGKHEEYRDPPTVDCPRIGRRWAEVFSHHAWMQDLHTGRKIDEDIYTNFNSMISMYHDQY